MLMLVNDCWSGERSDLFLSLALDILRFESVGCF